MSVEGKSGSPLQISHSFSKVPKTICHPALLLCWQLQVCSGQMDKGSLFESLSQVCARFRADCSPSHLSFALWESSIGPIFLPVPFTSEQTLQRGSWKWMLCSVLHAVDIRLGLSGRNWLNCFTSLTTSLSLFKSRGIDVQRFCLNLYPVKALFVASLYCTAWVYVEQLCLQL